MINKFFKHFFVIIEMFLVLLIIMFSFSSYYKEINNRKEYDSLMISECNEKMGISEDVNYIKFCNEIINNQDLDLDFFSNLTDMLTFRLRWINYFGFIIVIFPVVFKLSFILKNKFVLHYVTRDSFLNFLLFMLKKAYSYIWILPFLGVIILSLCGYNSTFDYTYSLIYGSSAYSVYLMNNPVLFIFLYIINLILYSIFYINLCLIVLRKYHNWFSCFILSCLLFVGIELFFEIVINIIVFQKFFSSEFGYLFNILNPFTFRANNISPYLLILFILMMSVVSFVCVYKLYCNEDRFVIDCEKNNGGN